jgi:hypothetical protein
MIMKLEFRRLRDGDYRLTWIKIGVMPWSLAAMERV